MNALGLARFSTIDRVASVQSDNRGDASGMSGIATLSTH